VPEDDDLHDHARGEGVSTPRKWPTHKWSHHPVTKTYKGKPYVTYRGYCDRCGLQRIPTGKPRGWKYERPNGDTQDLAGKCETSGHVSHVVETLEWAREVTTCIEGFRKAGLTDAQIDRELEAALPHVFRKKEKT
jgi:hypothetical protein